MLVKIVPTFEDRGCRVVSTVSLPANDLSFLDRSRYSTLVATHMSSFVRVRSRSRATVSRISYGSTRDRTRDIWVYCNKVLLVYGLTNLAKMEEESLDKMDPYQRGATDIIWESMMKGTYKAPGDNQEPLDYSYASAAGPSAGSGSNNLGSQEEASSTVEQFLSPGHNKYIIGPMVVRVMPDGRPVPGDAARPLPKDEDAEEFKVMRSKPVPSVEEIISRQTSYQEPRQPVVAPRDRYTSSQPQAVYMVPPSQYKAPPTV
ncbi:unnamed protein product [Timema podura]|uniref:Uncharacterized protein n=1 Tax=Timema podura TaxID=61482 RepID=A0ABN7PF40_TIMPD|nr:unnamed protein product [Timema podura]